MTSSEDKDREVWEALHEFARGDFGPVGKRQPLTLHRRMQNEVILTKALQARSSCAARLPTAGALAWEFHRVYEMLAPQYGYETRPETKTFDRTSPNGRLMTAVCAYILKAIQESLTLPESETPKEYPVSMTLERYHEFLAYEAECKLRDARSACAATFPSAWIREAVGVLQALHHNLEPDFQRVDDLLAGVPCAPEDLGFDSPADRAARSSSAAYVPGDPMENWLMKPALEWLEQAEHGHDKDRCKIIADLLRDLWRRQKPITEVAPVSASTPTSSDNS